jgi:hypothetical protein
MHIPNSDKPVKLYNLDVIISVGYRVKSQRGTQFRIWATQRLKEYIVKGFTMDDERLKNLGGGNYWKELLGRIRDIRSSEKVMYRQVLDLYATATDYDPKSDQSLTFFKIVQNKLHFAAHGHTASEVIYLRVDNDKPFAGVTNFKGDDPTQAEVLIAKNFLEEKELKVLNNLVVAYFDLAELVKSVFLSTCFVLKKVFLALNQKVETGIHRKRRNGDSSRIMRKPYLY